MDGGGHLKTIEMTNHQTTQMRAARVAGVFSFIGAIPRTAWLPPEIETDEKGFVFALDKDIDDCQYIYCQAN